MPELGSDGLILGSGLCPWSPTVALHVSLNSGVEAVLMCLDSLRLLSCAQNPHVGSSISITRAGCKVPLLFCRKVSMISPSLALPPAPVLSAPPSSSLPLLLLLLPPHSSKHLHQQ
ncbi:hypothetical protein M9H77_21616 [Catharanthus roseus]|uniref:Uncharacterized protein n=1 Tax=Catharanthus roseus TaxID=4058 RepID=A0ACC0AMV0_CATRO|nr:hypothetical protein M9H77_21616 [Catharanthus roseus]